MLDQLDSIDASVEKRNEKILGKDEAMGAVETLVRYIEKIDGDLKRG